MAIFQQTRPKIVVIDATNQGHIAWHGSRGQCDLSLVLRHRFHLIQTDWQPVKILAAFDSRESFRKRLDPTYKANRAPSPDGLQASLAAAATALGNVGYPVIGAEGFEAADAIATACCHARGQGYRVVIVSTDKDVRQCLVAGEVTIADRVHVVRGELQPSFVTAGTVVGRYGVKPEQWVDFQCLVGDTSDGIRGADGVGEKIAGQMLAVAGTLDELLANPWKYASSARVRDSLFEFCKRAPVVKQLVTLRTDVPLVEECFL